MSSKLLPLDFIHIIGCVIYSDKGVIFPRRARLGGVMIPDDYAHYSGIKHKYGLHSHRITICICVYIYTSVLHDSYFTTEVSICVYGGI